MTSEIIPVIDAQMLRGTPAERRTCADGIASACREVGFFHVVNHNVDPALLAGAFDVAQRYFARPLDAKMQNALSADTNFCGYFPMKGEVTDPEIGADPKEGYDIAFSSDRRHAALEWPPEPADLPGVLTRYHEALSALAQDLSRGFALALDLPEDFFTDRLDHPTSILRLLHYPAVSHVADRAALPETGCGAHSDYGYLTILAQDDRGGLQVQTVDGAWIDVAPRAGAYLCNIGEMMARWTNNRFRATPHRVIRVATDSRYSVPFFFHPNADVMIETLPTCLGEGGVTDYAPITTGQYLTQRLAGAFV
ncbi:2-oxoglutarate and iron-dependent oxygenase domain-containing protein [Acuticoccus sp. MNP-M23]|uniref:isopenicillin N synthase family dioxygenase n=1 Tax=Acuticoccus sp. MNP-M23 TaxID=3072793 RepID=UPI002815983A|nr:2OG-Fe(II) oxygenase family protein [Acuticoccus sp. MNP-M23]WMS41332.1 2-oxoglutarate and iron-dependent oxygenase domain-containing protein [Acuticoccus sp. MNP-M23]